MDGVATLYYPPSAAALTPDGRWALFQSVGTDLVNGATDTAGTLDVFLFDRDSGTAILVSRAVGSALSTPNAGSQAIALTADGRWVLYDSIATNIVSGGSNDDKVNAFLYDRIGETTMEVPGGPARAIALSDDGRWVLVQRVDENPANNGVGDYVDLFDRVSGTTTLVSRSAASATVPAFPAFGRALSVDGRYALFSSSAPNLVAGVADGNGASDVFVFDRASGATSLVSRSLASPTMAANGASTAVAMSPDGGWVVFDSVATDLAAASDSNNSADAFLFERATGTLTLMSRGAGQATVAANGSSAASAVTPDGRWALFESTAGNIAGAPSLGGGLFLFDRATGNSTLVSASAPLMRSSLSDDGQRVVYGNGQVFLFDRPSGTTTLVSRATGSGSMPANGGSLATEISADGGTILFDSNATDLVAGVVDANGATDVFLSRQMFQVTPVSGANGTLAPASPFEVAYGGTTSFTVTPAQGYAIGSVVGCEGTLVGQTYTTGAIRADCTVSATFVAASNEIFANGFENP